MEAFSTVPFARDVDFVARVEVMADLEAKFSTPLRHQRVALVGIGGMGWAPYIDNKDHRLIL